MTSMPFTSRSGAVAAFGSALMTPRFPGLLLFRAIALRDLLLRRIRLGGGPDHRVQDLHVGLVPIRRVAPVLAVPGVDAALAHALVVRAGGLQGLDHVAEAESLDLRGIEVQVLGAPAHFLAGDHALAVFRLRLLDR